MIEVYGFGFNVNFGNPNASSAVLIRPKCCDSLRGAFFATFLQDVLFALCVLASQQHVDFVAHILFGHCVR
jgi:hypothetical protein